MGVGGAPPSGTGHVPLLRLWGSFPSLLRLDLHRVRYFLDTSRQRVAEARYTRSYEQTAQHHSSGVLMRRWQGTRNPRGGSQPAGRRCGLGDGCRDSSIPLPRPAML
eukprot:scaffold57955_cov69-Phaeocystis_antarctica.AAC.3